MNVTIELMNASSEPLLPTPQDFRRWAESALAAAVADGSTATADAELSIRVVDEEESAALNAGFRHKQGPTNVLSFPYPPMAGTDINLLGDLAICAPLVKKEAAGQDKPVEAHWAHLTVHGVLHLKGYDHEDAGEAAAMEALETRIMRGLGYGDPYGQDENSDE